MFNDTSRYLDDIVTIVNPEFEMNIYLIYNQLDFSSNKANTSDKKTSFLDLNILTDKGKDTQNICQLIP